MTQQLLFVMRRLRIRKQSCFSQLRPSQQYPIRFPARSSTKDYSTASSQETKAAEPEPEPGPDFPWKFHVIDGVEQLEGYCPGGYHPVALGDRLNDRYLIVHKLGHGGFSTIWLSRDEKTNKYVSVKICIADTDEHISQERKILQSLSTSEMRNKYPQSSLILPLLDSFVHKGPNGEHECLVTPLARMSVYDSMDSSGNTPFQLPVARSITAQIIEAIAFLHSRGIVHADIRPDNVLFHYSENIDHLSPGQLHARFAPLYSEPLTLFRNEPFPPGAPTHGILPLRLGKDSNLFSLSEAKICLTDFGVAYQPSVTTRLKSHIPLGSAPPEYYFQPDIPQSFPADIWSLACTIFNTMGSSPLFYSGFSGEDTVMTDRVLVVGKPPPEWWDKWDGRSKNLHEDGTWNSRGNRFNVNDASWEQRVKECLDERRESKKMEKIGNEEKEALCNLLRAMLRYRPEERPTAQEVLESKWMKEWALPEVEKMRELTQKE